MIELWEEDTEVYVLFLWLYVLAYRAWWLWFMFCASSRWVWCSGREWRYERRRGAEGEMVEKSVGSGIES